MLLRKSKINRCFIFPPHLTSASALPAKTWKYQKHACVSIVKLDGCIVWNAHNTVLGEEARLIYIVPVCYVKTGRYGKPSNVIISLHPKKISIITNIPVIIS